MTQQNPQKKRDILEEKDKGISTAETPLARLWRQILFDLRIHPFKWGHLVQQYLTDPRNNISQLQSDIWSTRGNLNKDLRKPRMSIGNFLKGLKVLGPIKVKLCVELTWVDGSVTRHETDFVNRRVDSFSPDDVISAMGDEKDPRIGY